MKPRMKTQSKRSQQVWKNHDVPRPPQPEYKEKSDQLITQVDEQTQQLNSYIKEKGIQYVLDAIHEMELRQATNSEIEIIERTANQIIQAVMSKIPDVPNVPEVPNELQSANPIDTSYELSKPKRMPDIEKLKDLL
jgi:hypothetical protein